MNALPENYRDSGPRASGSFKLWQVDLRQPREWIEVARQILEPCEAGRRQREPEEVWRRRVVARAALRIALAQHLDREPRSLRFGTGPNAKPRLEPASERPQPCFNLAHSGNLCLIAISDDGAVGIDVEAIRNRPHRDRLVETRLAPSEANEILSFSGDRRTRAFYRCWTRKEAYLKALGVGLTADLGAFAVSVGDRPALLSPLDGDAERWSLFDIDAGGGHAAAIAVAGWREDLENPLKPSLLSI